MLNLLLALFLFLGVSCSLGGGNTEGPPDPDGESRETSVMDVTVGPERVDCVGVGPRKCLVVDGLYFYDSIDGFDYEPGYRYLIRMERYDAWPEHEEPPQDASMYGYRLIEILEKTRER